MKKCIWWILITAMLFSVIAFSLANFKVEDNTISFSIENSMGQSQTISAWQAEDGIFYVFLPSYSELNKVKYADENSIKIGGYELTYGTSCEHFEIEQKYELIANSNTTEICFVRSANVPTMYVNTISGNMNTVHENKNNKETATVTLVTSDGTIEHSEMVGTINGRGNSTWWCDKKPYLITLETENNLLQMGAGKKWVMLANYGDHSRMNNKLALDMARQVGFEWVPDCEYVDVYFNGEYNGLYLLTEKVEVTDERLDLDLSSGDFLYRIDFESRLDSFDNPIKTENGRVIDIEAPAALDRTQLDSCADSINAVEQLILNGGDLASATNVDIDSIARKYILDEITANTDSDVASCYYYVKSGVTYAGPPWDYDMCLGTYHQSANPQAFVAKHYTKYSGVKSLYYPALYENEYFRSRVSEIYKKEYLPILESLVNGGIMELSKTIEDSVKMNNIRWVPAEYDSSQARATLSISAESSLSYLKKRIEFLNSAWIDKIDYCTVRFNLQNEDVYYNVSVEKGYSLEQIPEYLNILYGDASNIDWYIEETGELFDPSAPVTKDLLLTEYVTPSAPVQDNMATEGNSFATQDYLAILSAVGIAIVFIGFAIVAIHRMRLERKYIK